MRPKRRIPKIIRNVIAPVQFWLLSQGRCVGCGAVLDNGKRTKRKDGTEKVVCGCGRIFIYDPKKKNYRRALLNEV